MNRKLCSLLLALVCQAAVGQARYANINVSLGMTVSEDTHRLSEDMVRLCAEETDISMSELAKFKRNDLAGQQTEATKCFTHCLYEQMGLSRDGVFVRRDFIGTLNVLSDPDYAMQRRCHELQAENKCERAFMIHKCLKDLPSRGHMKPSTNGVSHATPVNTHVEQGVPETAPQAPTGPRLAPPEAPPMVPQEYSRE